MIFSQYKFLSIYINVTKKCYYLFMCLLKSDPSSLGIPILKKDKQSTLNSEDSTSLSNILFINPSTEVPTSFD